MTTTGVATGSGVHPVTPAHELSAAGDGVGADAGAVGERVRFLQEYYGRRLKATADLQQKTCCTTDTQKRYADILQLIPGEVTQKHYGCGCPIPEDDLAGLTVLDLGSGAGVDAFIMAYKVGPSGFVHGIDMTPEQVEVARRNQPVVMRRFGYREPNTAFHLDFIETAAAIPAGSIDLVISDCVINLSPRKDEVFRTIYRVLRDGGEFYISDIAADRRLPEEFRSDPELVAECIGGAEYIHDWFDRMEAAGFRDSRVVSRRVVLEELRGIPIVLASVTVRGFKLREPLDRRCEDYGQSAVYRGNVPGSPARFALDEHHLFEAGRPAAVCRNTARMLSETRLGRYFEVSEPVRHFGLFPCVPAPAAAPAAIAAGSNGAAGSGRCC